VTALLTKRYGGFHTGGGLTGALAPGASTETASPFVFRAMPDEYVGVSYVFGIGGAVKSPDPNLNEVGEIRFLGETPAGGKPASSGNANPRSTDRQPGAG
jgi:hypothetical protein